MVKGDHSLKSIYTQTHAAEGGDRSNLNAVSKSNNMDSRKIKWVVVYEQSTQKKKIRVSKRDTQNYWRPGYMKNGQQTDR